jgi:hypothetical protein
MYKTHLRKHKGDYKRRNYTLCGQVLAGFHRVIDYPSLDQKTMCDICMKIYRRKMRPQYVKEAGFTSGNTQRDEIMARNACPTEVLYAN